MSRQQFEQYIAARANALAAPAIDWLARRDAWLRRLDEFYRQVEGYVEPYVSSRKIYLNFSPRQMHEEYVGSYEACSLDMEVGGDAVRFDPIGTNMIGTWGRVDMVGARGSVRFVLVPESLRSPGLKVRILRDGETPPPEILPKIGETTWKIATPPPRVVYEEINEDSFFSAIMEVLNA